MDGQAREGEASWEKPNQQCEMAEALLLPCTPSSVATHCRYDR